MVTVSNLAPGVSSADSHFYPGDPDECPGCREDLALCGTYTDDDDLQRCADCDAEVEQ